MKLYVRKKMASIKDVFNIYDENENEKYQVQGKVFSMGAKLTVSAIDGSKIAFIKERFNRFLPSFEFYVQDELVGTIREKVGWKKRYVVEASDIEVEGDWWGMTFTIKAGGQVVGSVSKKWFSWGDFYEIEITNSNYELISIALVLAIQMVKQSDDNATETSF